MSNTTSKSAKQPTSVRLDRWLWAARFFKTRSLAKAAIEGGKIELDGYKPKVSKEVAVGAKLTVQIGGYEHAIEVTGLADKRGSASIAQTLYQESDASLAAREILRAQLRMQRAGLRVPKTRPTKHQRQAIKALKQNQPHELPHSSSEPKPE